MNAKDLIQSIHDNGRLAIITTDEGVYYLDHADDGNKLIAGTACNIGIIPYGTLDYDADFSPDGNLEALFELILEKENEDVSR